MKTRKYIKYKIFLFLAFLLGIQYSCNKVDSNLKIFTATGAMLPVNEICESFYKNHKIEIEKNYAASGILARQIYSGADADIYISANKQWIDYLSESNLLLKNSVKELAKNKLVVISSKDKILHIKFQKEFDISSVVMNNISIGDPEYVPVGNYSKQVFEALNWYDSIKGNIILAKDVTSVLKYVEMGECEWGIVYYAEALKSDKIKIVCEIPQEMYNPIIFYIALLNDNQQSRDLYNYLLSTKSEEIFINYGFTIK